MRFFTLKCYFKRVKTSVILDSDINFYLFLSKTHKLYDRDQLYSEPPKKT